MSRKTHSAALLSLTFLFFSSGPLVAQASDTEGLMLGGHLSGSGITVEDGDRETGVGGGLRIGYGLHPNFTLFFQLDGSMVEVDQDEGLDGDWRMGHGDLGARLNFADEERSWVPYLLAALTGRVIGVEDPEVNGEEVADVEATGGAFTVGGGLMFYFNPSLALDLGLLFSGGEFTEIDPGPVAIGSLDLDASSTRLTIGITGWP